MNLTSVLGSRAKTFVVSTFTDLPFWKRWLVRIAVIALVVGFATWAIARTNGNEPGSWSLSGLRSGSGYLLGFAAGAFVRLFLKVGILLALVVAGAVWGLHQWGWIELPYESLADMQTAFTVKAQASASWLDAFFRSHLPHSAATGVGLFSGVTQKPRVSAGKPS